MSSSLLKSPPKLLPRNLNEYHNEANMDHIEN